MNQPTDIDILAVSIYRILADYFDVTLYRSTEREMVFWGNPRLHERGWKRKLNRRLAAVQVRAEVHRDRLAYRINVLPLPRGLGRPPLLNLLLFALTFLTVLVAAAYRETGAAMLSDPVFLLSGLPFTLTLLFILLVHEMGHFLTGHGRGVIMSYPFFIPAPTFLGTFGALIRSRTPIRTRNDLIYIGAAGPLTGAIPSVIALVWGLFSSRIVLPSPDGLIWGESLLTWAIRSAIVGPVPVGMIVELSPIALAGHVGLLVTMINLLPLGQLDGGHIVYGLLGRGQHFLAGIFLLFLFGLGFLWSGWWIWMVLALLMRPFHPAVIEADTGLERKAKIIGWGAMALFIVCFLPFPVR